MVDFAARRTGERSGLVFEHRDIRVLVQSLKSGQTQENGAV